MKHLTFACLFLLSACEFHPGGLPYEGEPDAAAADGDAGADGGDADAAPDADPGTDAAPPAATIVCSNAVIDGYPKIVLTFGGDIGSGFLGADPGAAPEAVAYGSNQEDLATINSCHDTWAVPYPIGCTKHVANWGAAPQLYLEPEVDYLNVALLYPAAPVRWGDLKTADGDPVGFTVSGLDCRIELVDGGTGGYIRTHPGP